MTRASTSDEADVRRLLHGLLDHEPALRLEPGPAVRAGRHLRRRRQVTTGALGIGLAGMATVGLVALVGSQAGDDAVVTGDPWAAGGSAPQQPPPPEVDTDGAVLDEPLSPETQVLLAVVEANSPEGLTFDVYGPGESTPGGVTFVEGTVDDGSGPGWLSVYITPQPGEQMVHPCNDPDFALGVDCNETVLADGSVLSVRGVAELTDGSRIVDVMLTRPDGTGVSATAGNFTRSLPDELAATEQAAADAADGDVEPDAPSTYGPQVSRPDPVYTADQLSALVQAVYASIS